ncbi:unnamed protein product [Phyllotreta striolata]|uniref:Uncharacterized protein n=1 Tax=Phyllotreta striolata TaxID=444603 RepID=A0A9N9TK98_PHYSR|nr:unnamed protein product [Phyllotreta striolata]
MSNNILGISYAILAGSALISYSRIHLGSYARFAYMGLISNGILGLFKWGGIEFDGFDKAYRIIEGIQDLFLLPCIASSLWVAYHYMKEIGLFNILVSFSPLMTLLLENKPVSEEYKNAIIVVNLTTLAVLSLVHNNFNGLAVTALYLYIHTDMVRNNRGLFGYNFQESYNCALALFAIASCEMIMSAY